MINKKANKSSFFVTLNIDYAKNRGLYFKRINGTDVKEFKRRKNEYKLR